MKHPRYPSLYQVNTRVCLAERAAALERPTTLDDISDRILDQWVRAGFHWVWLLGVWQTGPASRLASQSDPERLAEYQRVLPDFRLSDVSGSCFAVREYRVHEDFGGDEALGRFRQRLHERGQRLMLDFVPNHTALDHPWVTIHPEYYIGGTEAKLAAEPRHYCRVKTTEGERILAHGRDPYFPAWQDTLQLNYGHSGLREAMAVQLRKIAAGCDGVRCDMAMLVLPEVFQKTWGVTAEPFWPGVTRHIHDAFPGFVLLAEVYWDLEFTLQQQGFDYTYDKRLYDRLRAGQAGPVRAHLRAGSDYQDRLARFLENHDESRAAAAFPPEILRPAAVITYLAPGMRFFHQGQCEGRKTRIPVELRRGPSEPMNLEIAEFYAGLLENLRDPVFTEGDWQLLECRPAGDNNRTSDALVAYAWTGKRGAKRLVVVNYADHSSQGYLALPWNSLQGKTCCLTDRMGTAVARKNGDDLAAQGLYLDLAAWGFRVFELEEDEIPA